MLGERNLSSALPFGHRLTWRPLIMQSLVVILVITQIWRHGSCNREGHPNILWPFCRLSHISIGNQGVQYSRYILVATLKYSTQPSTSVIMEHSAET